MLFFFLKPFEKLDFLKSGSMVAGTNKVFCGTENGVCELTKDTVYVHPSAKQCSWSPSVGFVDLFKEVCSKTTTYYCTLTARDFGEGSGGGGGLYMIYWNVSVRGSVYCWGYRGDGSRYYEVGAATSGSSHYIYQFIYVSRVDTVIRASIIPGTWVRSTDNGGYSYDYSPSITFTFLSSYNGILSTEEISDGSGTLKLYKLKHYNWS